MATASPRLSPGLDRRGLLAAVIAFISWGLLPLYLKLLAGVPVFQVMSHRVIWACVFVFAWLGIRGQLGAVGPALKRPGTLAKLSVTAALISANWVIYVWAVASSHTVDASLGYFVNPLVSVLLGVFLLAEKLNARGRGWVHVNPIPLNPTPGSVWTASEKDVQREFVRRLNEAGIPTTLRDTRGKEIDGACGQLAAEDVD